MKLSRGFRSNARLDQQRHCHKNSFELFDNLHHDAAAFITGHVIGDPINDDYFDIVYCALSDLAPNTVGQLFLVMLQCATFAFLSGVSWENR